jgi:DNA-binding response OmpR family regulator
MKLDRKALVVDDDAGIRLLIKRVLSRQQFDVDLASDGAEAIEKILANDYAVIVLDLMMPRIDGATVVRYLEEHLPKKLSNVIVMTAFGPSAIREVCPPVGRYIEKPFDVEHLLHEVTECYWMSGADY